MADNLTSDQALPELAEVCKQGDYIKLKHLLSEYKAEMRSLRSCDHEGWQAVHYAVADLDDNHLKCVELLLSESMELIHEQIKEHLTPIMIACEKDNVHAVQKLINLLEPRSLELMSVHQDNALTLALKYSRQDIALLLLSKNTTIEFTDPSTVKQRPVNIACENMMKQVLQRLLDVGVSITVDTRRTNPVHACCRVGWSEGLQLIIDHQKQRNSSTPDDRPFQISIKDMLLRKDDRKCSPLNLICVQGSAQCASILFNEGISPLTSVGVPQKYIFPVAKAIYYRHEDLTKYLLAKTTAHDIDMVCKKRSESRLYTVHPFAYMSFDGSNESKEGWKFLIDCGFPFDLQHVPVCVDHRYQPVRYYLDIMIYELQRYLLLSALGYIMSTFYDTSDSNQKSLAVLELILKQGVTITPESVVFSCGAGEATSAHLLTLKYLSYRSQSEIQNVYDQVFVGVEGLVIPFFCDNYEVWKMDDVTYTVSSLIAIQFILKGFPVKMEIYEKMAAMAGTEPAVLFLSVADKMQWLSSFPQFSDHPYALLHNVEVPSSLKSLCRKAIRECLGSKLLREPVPRGSLEEEEWVADPTWELSCIDKLALPAILSDFVKFKDVISAYNEKRIEFWDRGSSYYCTDDDMSDDMSDGQPQ